jgi:hypothetical protein
MSKITRICENCKQPFEWFTWCGKGLFCSKKCFYESRIGKPSGANGKRWKLSTATKEKMSLALKKRYRNNPKYKKIVASIGKSNAGKKRTLEWRKERSELYKKLGYGYWLPVKRGSEHWHWMGGITPEKISLRKSQTYKCWRIGVFERDNYICQLCGIRGANMEADHYPIPFYKLYRDRDLKTMWDINNGRTLCRSCHKLETKKEKYL